MLRVIPLIIAAFALSACANTRPNVLLICVDDLRPMLGCYGAAFAQTPNIDALAARGLVFERHYVAFPTCGASRNAMLTGKLPTRPAHWTNGAFRELRQEDLGVPTIPATFRDAGFYTVCLGKVSHSHDGRVKGGAAEIPEAWDSLPTDPEAWGHARHLLHAYADGARRIPGKTPLIESKDVPDESYPDGILARQAVAQLRDCSRREGPFFMAVGFYKPHLPFAAPRRYFDLYDPASIPLDHSGEPFRLGRVHSARQSGEVTRNYACPAWEDKRWDADEQRAMRHAYLACVSYVDAQIGKLLAAVDELDLARRTIVVLWGDHGFHLGEQGLMGKHTTFEASLRSPLIIAAPGGVTGSTGTLASSYDLFPTLCRLARVARPRSLDGVSHAAEVRGDAAAERSGVPSFWRVGRNRAQVWRTERWRFVRWFDPDDEGASAAIELYDMAAPTPERANVANRFPRVVQRLAREVSGRLE